MSTKDGYDTKKLIALVKASGFKTKCLAEAVELAPDTMRKFLGGHIKLGPSSLKLLAIFLDQDPETLKNKAS